MRIPQFEPFVPGDVAPEGLLDEGDQLIESIPPHFFQQIDLKNKMYAITADSSYTILLGPAKSGCSIVLRLAVLSGVSEVMGFLLQ